MPSINIPESYTALCDRIAANHVRWFFFREAAWFVLKPVLIAIVAVLAILGGMRFAKAEDLAVGDSIALGTGSALHVRTVATTGASSCAIAGQAPSGSFDHVVISAGINDAPGNCIEALAKKYAGSNVVWILPAAINSARAHVAAVAGQYGDKTVSYRCTGGCSRSNFHPGSYPAVAAAVRRAWGERFGNRSLASAPASTLVGVQPFGRASAPVYAPSPGMSEPAPVKLRILTVPIAPSSKSIWQTVHDFFVPQKVSAILQEEAAKEGVPAELVLRVARVESHGQCSADNGIASGVMQVRPMTARAMGVTGNLHDCRTGAVAGVRFLKRALAASHGNWAVAAALYNGGLGARKRATGYSKLVLAAE